MTGRVVISLDRQGAHFSRIDSDGRVAAEGRLSPGSDSPVEPEDFVVCVVPSADCAVHLMPIDGDTDAQARGAARFAVAERLAAPAADDHVAVGPADDHGRRAVVVTQKAEMDRWLALLASCGVEPDVLVPSVLMLPEPEDGAVTAPADSGLDVRTPDAAYFADAGVAGALLQGAARRDLGAADAGAQRLARSELPEINLLQGDYGRRKTGDLSGRLKRVAICVLAIAVLALAAVLVDGLRHDLAADEKRAKVAALAEERGLTVPAEGDAVMAVRLALAEQGGSSGLRGASAALFAAVRGAPGTNVETIMWENGRLIAAVRLPPTVNVAALRPSIEGAGFRMIAGAQQPTDRGSRATVEIVP